MSSLVPWEKGFCGCVDFYIQKPGKWWKIVCQKCKCERNIKSPGVAVDTYIVSIPFASKHTEESKVVLAEDL